MERKILGAEQLADAVKTLDGWTADEKVLTKRFEFPDFAASLKLVNQIGAIAEAADHHPDITFGWGYASVALTTHDRGGITDVDINVARQIDDLDG